VRNDDVERRAVDTEANSTTTSATQSQCAEPVPLCDHLLMTASADLEAPRSVPGRNETPL
jgi:hypothetical protein